LCIVRVCRNISRQLSVLGLYLCFYVWLRMTAFNKRTWWWWRVRLN